MKNKHHRLFVKNMQKNGFDMPKKTLAKTPDLEALMDKDSEKDAKAFLVTIRGNRWVHIENYTGIAAYKENQVKIMGKTQMIVIDGRCLSLVYFTEDDVLVGGIIYAVRYV